MCLLTEQQQALVASEDITVYKRVKIIDKKHVRAAYYKFVYKLNTLYETKIIANRYGTYYDLTAKIAYLGKTNCMYISEAFHSMTLKRIQAMSKYYSTVEATIPKGSLYYKDITGLFASNQIIINKIL